MNINLSTFCIAILIIYGIKLKQSEALFEDDNIENYRKVIIRVPVEIKHLTRTVVKVVEKPSENKGMGHKHDGQVIHHHHHGGYVDHVHKHAVEAGKKKHKNHNLDSLTYANDYLTEPNYLYTNYEEKDEHDYEQQDRNDYRESGAKKLQHRPTDVYAVDVENYGLNVGHLGSSRDAYYFRHHNYGNDVKHDYVEKDQRKSKNLLRPLDRRYADGKSVLQTYVEEDPHRWRLNYFHSSDDPEILPLLPQPTSPSLLLLSSTKPPPTSMRRTHARNRRPRISFKSYDMV